MGSIKLNNKELIEYVIKLHKMPPSERVALFVKGKPGIGKSFGIRDAGKILAEELGLKYVEGEYGEGKFSIIDVRLGQKNPEDLKGLPMFEKDTKKTVWYIPNELPTEGSGIIFFDEMNHASHSVQNASFEIILDKKLSNWKVPDGFIIIAAGNGTEDNSYITEMSAALKNRFVHVELEQPSVDDWSVWAAANGVEKDIITFVNFKKEYMYKFDPNNETDAYPTHRSWVFGSNLIKGETKEHLIKRYLGSAVGEGIAGEYVAYHKMAAQLDVDAMIKNPDEFQAPKEVSMKYAIAGAFASRYSSNTKLLQNICKIWASDKLEPEFVVISMKMCKALKPRVFFEQMLKLKEWEILSARYSKYLME